MHVRFRLRSPSGQALALFGLSLTGLILIVGLVVDGGYALVQRRAAQDAADFAALSGARIVAERIAGDVTNGTDANVRTAISQSVAANGGGGVSFGIGGPEYVSATGASLGYVGRGSIPTGAVGVQVLASVNWRPFFLGLVGITAWTAGGTATARGGYAAGGPAGAVFPAGIAEAFFNGRHPCAGAVSSDPTDPCYPQQLTPGSLNVPGGFGWLKFGCAGYGLGQVSPASDGGCANSRPFLQSEIGPPGQSFGCCTVVGLSGSADQIGSLPGNKASADCSYWIEHHTTLTLPVWDAAGGTGSNAWYHIIGFTGFQITACDGGKDIQGVWRVPFFLGPTTTTPGFAGAPLAVELIH